MKLMTLAMIFVATLTSTATAENAPTGYQQVPEPETRSDTSKVQVIDFFWYGCPYCDLFEPQLQNWLESKPENVEFIRIPAIIRPSWSFYAQTFYTAEVLGILDRVHMQLYTAIHSEDQDMDSMDAMADFFSDQGINRSQFENTFHSDEVRRRVREARKLTQHYGIDSVPAIVVNNKYRTTPELAGGASRILNIVNELIATETKSDATP